MKIINTLEQSSRRRRSQLPLSVIVFLTVFLAMQMSVSAADFGIDPSFGTNGRVSTRFSDYGVQSSDVVIQSDGKIVVCGRSNRNFILVRYEQNGILDPAFGNGGIVQEYLPYPLVSVHSMLMQTDQKIIVIGNTGSGPYTSPIVLFRYNSDGSRDSTFGVAGQLQLSFGTAFQTSYDAAIQPDGRIILVGSIQYGQYGASNDLLIVRLNPDGSFDNSFGSGGSVIKDKFGDSDNATGVDLQTDGKLVIVGYGTTVSNPYGSSPLLLRFNSDGTADSAFGLGGSKDLAPDFAAAVKVKVKTDGKLVVFGSSALNTDFAVGQYNTDGTKDLSFGANGRVTTLFPGASYPYPSDGLIQADGKIVITGWGYLAVSGSDFLTARFLPDGSLDSTFCIGGKAVTDVSNGSSDTNSDIAIQTDGKIVVAGGLDHFGLVRYLPEVNNTAPTVVVAGGRNVPRGMTYYSLSLGEARDDSTSGADLRVSVINAPQGLSFSRLSVNSVVIFTDVYVSCSAAPGDNLVTIEVTDSTGLSTRATVNIYVMNASLPQYASPPPLSIGTGIMAMTVGYEQPNYYPGSVLSFSSDTFAGSLTVEQSTGWVYVGNASPAGTHVVTVTRTSSCGQIISRNFNLVVESPVPVVTITEPSSGAIYPVGSTVNFSGTFVDSGGGSHTANWNIGGIIVPGIVDESTSTISGVYTFGSPGVYPVSLTVSNGYGNSATASTVNGDSAIIYVLSYGQSATPAGQNVEVPTDAGLALTFDQVDEPGITNVQTIDAATIGEVPGGFALSESLAFQLSTSATFTGSVTIAFVVPDPISEAEFADLIILHNDNGSLVDVTATSPARDYSTRTIFAVTNSFSPFYVVRRGGHVKPLFDQTKAYKRGSTIPIKLQMRDAGGSNISSPSMVLTARSLRLIGGTTTVAVIDSGNANPDNNFRYESGLGGSGGGYIFNLSTKGLNAGRYVLSFYAGTDHSFFHTVVFEIK